MSAPSPYSAVAPAWSDNVPLDTLTAAAAGSSAAVQVTNSSQRFWSTPARPADSPVREVMEISLSTPRLINKLVFEAATYPQDIHVEHYDEQTRSWAPLIPASAPGPDPLHEVILESVPGVIPPANAVTGHLHPQHSYSGHWQQFTAKVRPVTAKKLRFVLARSTKGAPPRDTFGRLIDYSLGLNNVTVGYEVASPADVPRTGPTPGSYTERDTFASTSDLLGSAVNYSIRTNSAKNVLQNGTGAAKNKLVWKSEPQPFPWAVCNFYVDGRDPDGNPQVIDKFYLEPLTDGANINLYYSNDEPSTSFVAGDDPLPPNVGVITGSDGPNVLGSEKYGDVNFVDINNTAIGFNPGQVWWLGATLTFNFAWANDNNDHALFDCGAFNLAMTPAGLLLTTAGQDSLLVTTPSFDAGTEIKLLAYYDGRTVHLATSVGGERQDGSELLAVPMTDATVGTIRVGGFLGADPGSGSFQLESMVLKIHEVPGEDVITGFFADPTGYAIKPALAIDDTGRTDNAILRYDPASSTVDFPSGFLGGPPDHYAEMTWSPIARDYVLRKGYLNLPPTKARYWKLEFCNLVPAPYEVYVPVKRTIRTYSRELWAMRPVASVTTLYSTLSVGFPGLSSTIALSSRTVYKDQRGATMYPATNNYSKTQVRIVNDVTVQASLGSAFWAWNFVSWHADVWCPRFVTTCVHEYQYVDIEQTSKIAYFVGLQKIEAYRLNYLSTEDTGQYVELFHDLNNISEDANWTLVDDHQLTSGDSKFAQIDSKPMPANKMIRAVQFATTQSQPKQVLPDDDFDDPTHQFWSAVGDGHLAPHTEQVATLGSVLRIDRSPHPLDWGTLETSPGTWGEFEARTLTYRIVEQLGNPAGEFGGIESALYDTPPGGRIHAAARAVTPKDLTGPLYVQIVDESDRVLSESGTTVRSGQVAEWYTSYTIGEGGRILAYRWDDFTAPKTFARFVDSFDHVNSSVLALMDSGQAWTPAVINGVPTSHSIAANAAVQNASGTALDAFSTDTIWGAVDFIVGTMGTGTQVPLIGLDPFTLNDQGALSFAGGNAGTLPASVFGRALVTGDAVHIDVLPTKAVPQARKDPSAPLDDVSSPYSMVFYLNGTWTTTFSHRLGMGYRKFIQGRANQQFRSFSWTPAAYDQPLDVTVWQPPVATAGGAFDPVGATWTSGAGTVWTMFGPWDNSTSRLVALADAAEFHTLTDTWYGTLHTRVHHIAAGNAANPNLRGNLLVLDAEHGVYLDAYGYVNQGGTAWTRLFPSGIPADSNISVQFADTKQVAYSVRGNTIDATATPRMLIGRLNGVVSGVWASNQLDAWTGLTRGLAGSAYNNGVDSDGNPLPPPAGSVLGDVNTSFDLFDWAPDTSTLALAPNAPTWDEVTKRGTATYAQASQGQLLEPNRFRARLVQKGESNDVWEVDTLSMFVEPIVWYFSNDGGVNFYPAYDIRNDPQGVLTFPSQDPTQPYNPDYGQELVWRAVSYAPNSTISSLVIRPWYAGLVSGVTHRVGVFSGDPNVMPYDHYPSLESDPRFQTWHLPIPQEWWFSYRILQRSKDAPVETTETLLLSDAFITDLGSN